MYDDGGMGTGDSNLTGYEYQIFLFKFFIDFLFHLEIEMLVNELLVVVS